MKSDMVGNLVLELGFDHVGRNKVKTRRKKTIEVKSIYISNCFSR